MRIVIIGPAGNMGRLIVQEALKRRRDFMIVGGVVPYGRPYVRQDIGKATETGFVGATLYDELEYCIPIAQGVIDFTTPEATMTNIKKCVEYRRPLVIGTTGFEEIDIERIKYAANKIPIILNDNKEEPKAATVEGAIEALEALLFLKGKKPGIYTFADVENAKNEQE